MASYDAEGVWVCKAFKPSIVESALKKGTFDRGFGLDRMTWIKPSFGWMLYRSGYASKHRPLPVVPVEEEYIIEEGLHRPLGMEL